jgi:hypothetical protein
MLHFEFTRNLAIRCPHGPKGKVPNGIKVKMEAISLKAEKPKCKLEVYLRSDNNLEHDGASIDSQLPSGSKAARNGKGKAARGSGSKAMLDMRGSSTRKSTRLDASAENISKKQWTMGAPQPEALFRRLASQFAIMGRTCEELANCTAS